MWQVTGPNDERGWIFGTVHALPRNLAWETPALDAAVADADRLVLEIADGQDDPAAARATFLRLGTTPGQEPIEWRVRPDLRGKLKKLLAAGRVETAGWENLEDWAAALSLSLAMEAHQGFEAGSGADRALLARAGRRPVEGLETLEGQLAVFDKLDGDAQAALLDAVVEESADPDQGQRLVKAWASGDVEALARETYDGMLANPTLRKKLLVERNQAWAGKVDAMLRGGEHPFVAVGAAHVAGDDGLPALLQARGWEVKRVQ